MSTEEEQHKNERGGDTGKPGAPTPLIALEVYAFVTLMFTFSY